MEDNNASPHELLDDLTRLSQAGRLRYLKTLSRDDLIEVLSFSLQQKDDLGESGSDMKREELSAPLAHEAPSTLRVPALPTERSELFAGYVPA